MTLTAECRVKTKTRTSARVKFAEVTSFLRQKKEGLNVSHVIVGNLSSFVLYTMKIFAKNRVSELARRKYGIEGNLTEITVRTNRSGEFEDVNRISQKFLSMCLSLSHWAWVESHKIYAIALLFQNFWFKTWSPEISSFHFYDIKFPQK